MKYKSLMSGMVIGAILATSISAFANNYTKVEALLVDSTHKIKFDGTAVALPEGMHILSYDGITYTPARLIAERLGATVDYDDTTKSVLIKKLNPLTPTITSSPSDIGVIKTPQPTASSNIGVITSPKPTETTTPSPTTTTTATPSPSPTSTNYNDYTTAPDKKTVKDVTITVNSMNRGTDLTRIYIDIENKNSNYVMVDYLKAYIEVDGTKYEAIDDSNATFSNSVNTFDNLTDKFIDFKTIPEDQKAMKIVIPVKYVESSLEETHESIFKVKFE